MTKFKEISTRDLELLISNKDVKIIDVRSVQAYNGWQLNGELRGGHIKGAKSLPAQWINFKEWNEIIIQKNLLNNNNIVIYGYSKEQSQKVADRLKKLGSNKNIYLYNSFVSEWSANTQLPMDKLANYKALVSPEWVNQLISGETPMHFKNNKFIVVHSHYRNRDAYLGGHIPNAIDMDTLALESPETWNRRSPEELKSALEKHGITADTTVILYGKFMKPKSRDKYPGSSAGVIAAFRNALIMMYAGVKDVRILNGGFKSWVDAGYSIDYEDVAKNPVAEFGVEIPREPELIVDLEQAKEMLISPDSELVCVRSDWEYLGEVSGYNYIKVKGRIPGAVFADCGSDAYHMENYRNLDHTTREYHEIAENWSKTGIIADKHLAFYCGTGWRGSEAWFNAWLMGWPKVSLFDGGWFEWSNDPDNPIETGIPDNFLF